MRRPSATDIAQRTTDNGRIPPPASRLRPPASRLRRTAFTLVELLVAITIILILSVLAVTMVNVALDSDRSRSSARQIQSYLEGARDRAIFAGAPRGVRFLLEENGINNAAGNPRTVAAMVFVGNPGVARGTLRISSEDVLNGTIGDFNPGGAEDLNNNGQDDAGRVLIPILRFPFGGSQNPAEWTNLTVRRLLSMGARIKLINGSNDYWLSISDESFDNNGRVRTFGTSPNQVSVMYLAQPHPDYLDGLRDPEATEHDLEYEIELAPAVLPNQEPIVLAKGIVLDLDSSQLPSIWHNPARTIYSNQMDVMFSPRGTVTGPAAAFGMIHFVLADIGDVERGLGLIDRDIDGSGTIEDGERNEGDKLVVTQFSRTGHISTHPIDPTDVRQANGQAGPDGFADDPFFFAETGDVAK